MRFPAVILALLLLVPAGCSRTQEAPAPPPRYAVRPPKVVPDWQKGTITELVDVGGTVPLIVSGYGLVVNLENTGRDDGVPTAVRQAVARTAADRGVGGANTQGIFSQVSPTQVMADPRTAVVRVEAVVPPGARKGQRVDVVVSALDTNTTPSLARGFLWQTELFQGRVSPQNPGEQVNRVGAARGPLVVNPAYALAAPEAVKDDPAATASLRRGIVPDGGMVNDGRRFVLRLRQPSRRTARGIEQRINLHFGRAVAAAQDEGTVWLVRPNAGHYAAVDPAHFLRVALNLYFRADDAFGVEQAKRLAEAALDPATTADELADISAAWEGIGYAAMPTLLDLVADPNPAVDYHASKAAAHLGESAATDRLVAIAGESSHPHAVRAARELGEVADLGGEALRRSLRRLLDESVAADPQVRIEAYESLLRAGEERAILEQVVPDKFRLHLVPAQGSAIVYARRTGTPTIAVIGGGYGVDSAPRLAEETVFSAFGDRLTIVRREGEAAVNLFQRNDLAADGGDSDPRDFVDMRSRPDLVEIVGRLGGEGATGERRLRLNYGDVIAVLKALGDAGHLVSGAGDELQPVPVALQDAALEQVDDAPVVPGLEALQTRTSASAAE